MTEIRNFQDILDALENNPSYVDALRRHLLTQDLLDLPKQMAELRILTVFVEK